MNKTEEILDTKESFDFLRGANRVLVRIAMKEHTARTLDKLKEKVKEKAIYFPTGGRYLTEKEVLKLIKEVENEG